MDKYRTFTPEFKAQIVLAILSGAKSQAEICREHHLKDWVVIRWKNDFLENVQRLEQAGTAISMAEVGAAWQNGCAERLTLASRRTNEPKVRSARRDS